MKTNNQYLLVSLLALLAIGGIVWTFFASRISPFSLSPEFARGAQSMRIKHLGTLNLQSLKINGVHVEKLSDLAWDGASQTLYALSDHGYLFSFAVQLDGEYLTGVQPLSVVPLRDARGHPLKAEQRDAEGLAILPAYDTESNSPTLLVAFEHNTRVSAYDVAGHWLRDLELPRKLQRKEDYYKRNNSLESILVHPRYGVIVAPELFMEKESKQRRVLYALNPELDAMRWQFPSLPYPGSGVTAIDVADDGSIIILERSWPNPLSPLVIGLRRIRLEECKKYLPCIVEDLAVFNTDQGWKIDNYEGLTHFKGNQFFMVSDNNTGILQNTLLTLFEIVE